MKKILLLILLTIAFTYCSNMIIAKTENQPVFSKKLTYEENIQMLNNYFKSKEGKGDINGYEEYPINIITFDGIEIGKYISFLDDKGYMVIGQEGIYDIVYDKASHFNINPDISLLYSVYDGYIVDGVLEKNISANEFDDFEAYTEYSNYEGVYDSNKIYNLDSYAYDRYGATSYSTVSLWSGTGQKQTALSVNNGNIDGYYMWEVQDIIENIMSDNYYNFDTKQVYLPSNQRIMDVLDQGLSLVLSVTGHPAYNSHMLFVEGYRIYTQVEYDPYLNELTFNFYYFLEIRDGHYSSEMYYDINDFYLTIILYEDVGSC